MKPILVLGGGGHAGVVIDALLLAKCEVVGFLDQNPETGKVLGINQLGDADPNVFIRYKPDEVILVNGFGSAGKSRLRFKQYAMWKASGFKFYTVIHPRTIIAADVVLGEGVQVMAGAVVQTGCVIGENTLINTRAVVDHGCQIGKNVHVATGAVLSGGVSVNEDAHIGAGATVIQGIHIGANSVVAAGSVVVRDVPANSIVKGAPAHHHCTPFQRID